MTIDRQLRGAEMYQWQCENEHSLNLNTRPFFNQLFST